VDQLALGHPPSPGIGHNQSPGLVDPIDGLNIRLATSHADLVARFRDLELACARVPDLVASEEDAATATDFIAQCQTHIKKAEAAHKKEKELFLKAGRAVDAFFKRRCDKLSMALAPAISRLKVYRDEIAEAERQRHEDARRAAEEEARRATAERLAVDGQSVDAPRKNCGLPRMRRSAPKLLAGGRAPRRSRRASAAITARDPQLDLRGRRSRPGAARIYEPRCRGVLFARLKPT
jgi:hypothetical protein